MTTVPKYTVKLNVNGYFVFRDEEPDPIYWALTLAEVDAVVARWTRTWFDIKNGHIENIDDAEVETNDFYPPDLRELFDAYPEHTIVNLLGSLRGEGWPRVDLAALCVACDTLTPLPLNAS